MKKTIFSLFVVSALLITLSWNASAQEITGGTIEYDQVNYHKFERREGPGSERFNNFVASLPSTTKDLKMLVFTTKKSLYKESNQPEDPGLARMKMGVARINTLKPPTLDLVKVYTDLAKGQMIKQLSFMTRFFLMEGLTKQSPWKIGTEQVKIQGYTCQQATMQKGEKTITAWFTPEIPISAGPADYEGLPGLILSIEEDGRNIILATSIDLTEPDSKMKKPKEGTKVDQIELDLIVAEKIEEWQKAGQQRRGGGGGR